MGPTAEEHGGCGGNELDTIVEIQSPRLGEVVITDAKIAKKVSDLLLEVNGRLNDSISTMQGGASNDEFVEYRLRTGWIMNSIFEELLKPIYRKHPDIKPPGLEM
jgi:hypothetical protein